MTTTKERKLFKQNICEGTLKELDSCRQLLLLNLRYCRLNCDNVWKILCDKKDLEITELKLNYTELHGKVSGLAECIVLKKVQKLSLVNTNINNDDLRTLGDELSKQDGKKIQLRYLNLMHNAIEPGGFQTLAKICNILPETIEVIDVSNCELDDKAVKNFLGTISVEKIIKTLIMSQNDAITPKGMVSVGQVAEKCKTETLDLSVCSMEDEHLDEIAKTRPKKLRHLRLSQNTKLSADAVGDLYQDLNWLKIVDVKECWFDREDLKWLANDLDGCQLLSDEMHSSDEEIEHKTEVSEHGQRILGEEPPQEPALVPHTLRPSVDNRKNQSSDNRAWHFNKRLSELRVAEILVDVIVWIFILMAGTCFVIYHFVYGKEPVADFGTGRNTSKKLEEVSDIVTLRLKLSLYTTMNNWYEPIQVKQCIEESTNRIKQQILSARCDVIYMGTCYYFLLGEVNYQIAQIECKRGGGELLKIFDTAALVRNDQAQDDEEGTRDQLNIWSLQATSSKLRTGYDFDFMDVQENGALCGAVLITCGKAVDHEALLIAHPPPTPLGDPVSLSLH